MGGLCVCVCVGGGGSLDRLTADIVLLNRTGLAFLQSVLWLSVSPARG